MYSGNKNTTGVSSLKEGVYCPKITIDAIEEAKIRKWVDLCDMEISGLGKVIIQPDGTLHVNSVYLLEQEVSAAETELDDDSVASLLYEAREDEGEMIFWWHSHVNMPVFWSGTDLATIEQFGKNGALLSAVYNKKGERRVSLYCQGEGFHPTVFEDNIIMVTDDTLGDDIVAECTKQFNDKVTKATYSYSNYNGYYAGQYTGSGYNKGSYNKGDEKGNDSTWFDKDEEVNKAMTTTPENTSGYVSPYSGVRVCTFSDDLLKQYGFDERDIDKCSTYCCKIVSKWWAISLEEREQWRLNYYDWHSGTEKPKDYNNQKYIAEYCEFADSFDWDIEELVDCVASIGTGGMA